jgi:hypothetical protein
MYAVGASRMSLIGPFCCTLGYAQVKPFVVAQRYLTNPLLIHGRKFGLRVWVVLTNTDPMRAYIHTNGLVLFSSSVSQQQQSS